ncbi:MAG: UvrB/UvrC motif-containing protein [bacterium]
MLCNMCHKKEAVVHFTEIIENQITKLHICEDCAKQKGLQFPFGKPLFSMADLLAGLTNFEAYSTEQQAKIKCPKCGVTYNDFKRNGKLGCCECYTCFHTELATLLKRIHGGVTHLGKLPVSRGNKTGTKKKASVETSTSIERQLRQLQSELQDAVKREEYERAAIIRDRIKGLKDKLIK